MKQKLVVLSGAGISAESGLKTFRDSDGLWENYNVYDVATPEAWQADKELVQRFYNERRKQVIEAEPNDGHRGLVQLEEKYDVHIITQNIDDLHERAGSNKIMHLHGEIRKSRSSLDSNLIYDIDGDVIEMGAKCEKGSQLRPHVVWFGEAVPMMEEAEKVTRQADILVIVGTSLNVYPAAGLAQVVSPDCRIFLIDPGDVDMMGRRVEVIKEKATVGVQQLLDVLM